MWDWWVLLSQAAEVRILALTLKFPQRCVVSLTTLTVVTVGHETWPPPPDTGHWHCYMLLEPGTWSCHTLDTWTLGSIWQHQHYSSLLDQFRKYKLGNNEFKPMFSWHINVEDICYNIVVVAAWILSVLDKLLFRGWWSGISKNTELCCFVVARCMIQ